MPFKPPALRKVSLPSQPPALGGHVVANLLQLLGHSGILVRLSLPQRGFYPPDQGHRQAAMPRKRYIFCAGGHGIFDAWSGSIALSQPGTVAGQVVCILKLLIQC
eukprot:TRINITY_DN12407_c0_g1_i7.p2 TRINITY_DN12407_c0_g1~~TRINITY_DN12407_c0_g1_i7.p2  ORF type:complete len:105 (-),score=5.90 TRINITY_DN12407_c0_g1_i7:352-666(-)